MTGSPEDPGPSRGPNAYWRTLRDLVILAAVGILAYVALAVADPRALVAAALDLVGPSSVEALMASLLVVAFTVAFLTWRRSLELIRDVEARQDDRERLERLAEMPRMNPDPVVVVDLGSGVSFVNEAAEETFEDLAERGVDHPLFDGIRDDLDSVGGVERERVIETEVDHDGRVYETRVWLDTADGAARVYLHDVTDHRQMEEDLRESRERLKQMTDHIQEVFWMTDPEREETLYVSAAYETIWGRSRESRLEEPDSWIEAVHPDDRPRVRDALDKQVEGEYDEEYRIVRPDGEVRWIRDRAYPIEGADGEVERIVGVAADVTGEREAFDRLTDALDREQLLVDVIGHDVSNLLTRALPRLDLLERREPEMADEVERVRKPLERADEILEQTTLLLRLEVDEVESGDKRRLGVLVSDVLEGLAALAEEEGIEVARSNRLERDPLVDPLVGRAFENVVENAIEHSPEGEVVSVVLEDGPEGGAEIRVEDDGPGIPEDLRGALFERFERGDAADEGETGGVHGLGLAISQRILERVGGSLWWEEPEDGGTRFVLELPCDDGVPGGTAGDGRAAADAP